MLHKSYYILCTMYYMIYTTYKILYTMLYMYMHKTMIYTIHYGI